MRSGCGVGSARCQRPQEDVAKRHLPLRIVTPDPYANLDPVTAGLVEREIDVDRVNPCPFRLKTRRSELSPRIGIDKEGVPGGLSREPKDNPRRPRSRRKVDIR